MNSSELRGFLTGLLIGDGSIDPGVTKRSFNIKSIDKCFIDKIHEELKSCTNFDFKFRNLPEHDSCGCHHKEAWELRVLAHPYFAKIYHRFYNDYRHRVITKYVTESLTPYGLALWYMSDGYVCLVGKTKGQIRSRRIDFATDRYTKEEVEMLVEMLNNKFGIKANIIKRGDSYRVRVNNKGYAKFLETVTPFIIPSMQYKLYLGYENQPIWMTDDMWNLQCSIRSAIAQTDNAVGEDIVCDN